MFKYIGYDLRTDTLIATNNEAEWACTLGHRPQEAEYFSSIGKAVQWINDHPNAHKEFLEEIEKMY